MDDMKLVVVGAAGRMGRTLIRIVAETPGVVLAGAVEREGAAEIGSDAGVLAGLEANGVAVTDDPLPVFARADGVLDFTSPAATIQFSELAAQARIVHVIGTTGIGPEDEAKILAAARHAPVIKSGNMSLGVNLLAVLVRKRRRRSTRISTSRFWRCTTATRSMRPPARRCCSARRRPRDAASTSPSIRSGSATAIPARASAATSASRRCAAAR